MSTPRRARLLVGPTMALTVVLTVGLVLGLPVSADAQRANVRLLDLSEPVSFYIAEAEAGSGVTERDRTLALWALEAWGELANPPVRFVPDSAEDALIRVFWVPAGGGMYGEMRDRRVDGRRGADLFVRPDTDGLGAAIAEMARRDPLFRDTIVYLTCVHELGHAFGLVHTSDFADIMYSFQWGGDIVAYFMRFREQLGGPESIRTAEPFSRGDRESFEGLYP